jgi:hypothetical protein
MPEETSVTDNTFTISRKLNEILTLLKLGKGR